MKCCARLASRRFTAYLFIVCVRVSELFGTALDWLCGRGRGWPPAGSMFFVVDVMGKALRGAGGERLCVDLLPRQRDLV